MSNLCYRRLDAGRDASLYGSLRYTVFVLRRQWLPGNPITHVELDHLDDHAIHIGVFETDKPSLLGYVRLIKGGTGGLLMEQVEFRALLPLDRLDASVVEVSRLCMAEVLPRGVTAEAVMRQFYLAIYEYMQQQNVTLLYATVEDHATGYITKSTLEQIGFVARTGPHQMAAGVDTYVMRMDLSDPMVQQRVQQILGL